jgi:hypothetical protein
MVSCFPTELIRPITIGPTRSTCDPGHRELSKPGKKSRLDQESPNRFAPPSSPQPVPRNPFRGKGLATIDLGFDPEFDPEFDLYPVTLS